MLAHQAQDRFNGTVLLRKFTTIRHDSTSRTSIALLGRGDPWVWSLFSGKIIDLRQTVSRTATIANQKGRHKQQMYQSQFLENSIALEPFRIAGKFFALPLAGHSGTAAARFGSPSTAGLDCVVFSCCYKIAGSRRSRCKWDFPCQDDHSQLPARAFCSATDDPSRPRRPCEYFRLIFAHTGPHEPVAIGPFMTFFYRAGWQGAIHGGRWEHSAAQGVHLCGPGEDQIGRLAAS